MKTQIQLNKWWMENCIFALADKIDEPAMLGSLLREIFISRWGIAPERVCLR